MSLASEFKEFAMKGSVVDLAVGVIIGAAFGKIVSSLVGDLFMPVLGKSIGGINFSDLAINLGKDPAGKDVLIKYGAFAIATAVSLSRYSGRNHFMSDVLVGSSIGFLIGRFVFKQHH